MKQQWRDGMQRSERLEREQRMRYEVLLMLYKAWRVDPGGASYAWTFATDLGVWQAELFRVVEYLDRIGYVEYMGAGPLVRITPAGVRYIEEEARGRRTIR